MFYDIIDIKSSTKNIFQKPELLALIHRVVALPKQYKL